MENQNFLNQSELARRWKISPRTLERWRWEGFGPRHMKIGGRILYRLVDIHTYENENLRDSTAKDDGVPLSNVEATQTAEA
jgi:hypothetical protein